MKTDVGEYLVGAYLKLELGCDVVDYNVRPPGGKLSGLGELDVVGYDFANSRAYLCEVTTHIRGLLIGGSLRDTIKKLGEKHQRQCQYAKARLGRFTDIHYHFWSPYVPKGYLTNELPKLGNVELFINGRYRACIEKLRSRAKQEKHDVVNPAFRLLQILEAMRLEA